MNAGWGRPLLIGTIAACLLAIAAGVGALGLLWSVTRNLPRLPENPAELGARPGTEIHAASGKRIYSFNQSREWVALDQISLHVVQALLATEDEAFYRHRGMDVQALFGAMWANLRHGFGRRGGSTLTQQLVKRLFFSPEKTLERKLAEMLLALELEALYARQFPGTTTTRMGATYPAYKDRLLELYLNTVFYGANAYGIADAAEVFFGRSPRRLSLPQAALLIGLINAPSAYNPLQHPERATRRLQHVLDRMHQTGFLSGPARKNLEDLQAEDLIDLHQAPQNPAPYWVEAVKAEVARRWGPEVLRHGALRIYTTLDMRLQRAAEEAVAQGVAELDQQLGFESYEKAPLAERPNYVQAALACLDPHTGQVKAMVGGRDIFISYYNRALTARRQPGSGFKPVAYLAALEAGAISPVTLFMDEPRVYEVEDEGEIELWAPRNYQDHYLGLTTASWALIHSANSTAIQVTRQVGPERVVATARKLGFAGPMGPYMSIALGVSEVTVLEMTSAYGALAASGLLVEPTLVTRIADAEGRELFAHQPRITQALSPELAHQMVQLLQQVLDRGTGRQVRRLGFERVAAGKTGTTNDNTDAWFTGFTPDLVASVWVGFDERRGHQLVDQEGKQITGGSGAAPIWTSFMLAATQGRPEADFPTPAGVRRVEVDPRTGTLAAAPPDTTEKWSIAVVLRPHERVNAPEEVVEFQARATRAQVDSLVKIVD